MKDRVNNLTDTEVKEIVEVEAELNDVAGAGEDAPPILLE